MFLNLFESGKSKPSKIQTADWQIRTKKSPPPKRWVKFFDGQNPFYTIADLVQLCFDSRDCVCDQLVCAFGIHLGCDHVFCCADGNNNSLIFHSLDSTSLCACDLLFSSSQDGG